MAYDVVRIDTAEGSCPTAVFTPNEGRGPWPATLFLMDGLGIRPTLLQMAQRLANGGFVVALPDLFYRIGPYEPIDARAVFASDTGRTVLRPFIESTDNRRAAMDVAPVIDHLVERDDVEGQVVGTTGYCMGGAISLTVAGMYPERIAAAASFHGGGLATDSELSPHLQVGKIRGRVYIGAADADRSYPPDMAGRLVEALMGAGVEHRHDLYVGAAHGWTMPDFPVFNESAAERHWTELFGLFDNTLR